MAMRPHPTNGVKAGDGGDERASAESPTELRNHYRMYSAQFARPGVASSATSAMVVLAMKRGRHEQQTANRQFATLPDPDGD